MTPIRSEFSTSALKSSGRFLLKFTKKFELCPARAIFIILFFHILSLNFFNQIIHFIPRNEEFLCN